MQSLSICEHGWGSKSLTSLQRYFMLVNLTCPQASKINLPYFFFISIKLNVQVINSDTRFKMNSHLVKIMELIRPLSDQLSDQHSVKLNEFIKSFFITFIFQSFYSVLTLRKNTHQSSGCRLFTLPLCPICCHSLCPALVCLNVQQQMTWPSLVFYKRLFSCQEKEQAALAATARRLHYRCIVNYSRQPTRAGWGLRRVLGWGVSERWERKERGWKSKCSFLWSTVMNEFLNKAENTSYHL